MKIYPSPKLPLNEYLPGIGADGAEVPDEEAEDLIARGLAVKTKPSKPAAPAKKSEE